MLIEERKYYNEDFDMFIRYHIDTDGVWYNYYDICELLEYNENKMKYNYDKLIDEINKREYEVEYEDNRGNIRKRCTGFINTIAAYELLKRNEERNRRIRFCIGDIELYHGIRQDNDENNHCLKVNLNLMKSEFESDEPNLEALKAYSKAVYDSPQIQKIINTNYYDFETEEEFEWYDYSIEMMKEEICNAIDNNELEQIVLKKRNSDRITFKLKESSCPSWLRNVVK